MHGSLLCPKCGKNLTKSLSTNRIKIKYPYYHCNSKCGYRLNADNGNKIIEEFISKLKFRQVVIDLYEEILVDRFKLGKANKELSVGKIKKELNEIEKKIDDLDNLLLKGLSISEFERMKNKFEFHKNELKEKIKESSSDSKNIEEYIASSKNLLKCLPEIFKTANAKTKNKIVCSIFPEKLMIPENKIRTQYKNTVVELMTNIDKGFSLKKKGQDSKIETLPCGAPRAGLEPATP